MLRHHLWCYDVSHKWNQRQRELNEGIPHKALLNFHSIAYATQETSLCKDLFSVLRMSLSFSALDSSRRVKITLE